MKPIDVVYLGTTNYHGEPAEAYREEYTDSCRFIIKTKKDTIVIMEYPKIS